jgi:L-ascorbate metabolism protein UlaG (beta-lactamase superfamily)
MIEPVLKDEAFLADVAQARLDDERLHLWWLGQSGFLVLWHNTFVLLDPYLSDSLTKKYAGTDKPHVRVTERLIAPERLDFVNIITSSHNHTDHLDGETITPLLEVNPNLTILVSEANRPFAAQRLQVPPERLTGIRIDQPLQIGDHTFWAIPSSHETVEVDSLGNPQYMGLVMQCGGRTLYHSGDTIRYEGMAERLRDWQIDLALLPINGRDPQRGVAGNLSGAEAARLARDSRTRLVIPCHYEMFEFNSATPEEFIQTCQEINQPYQVLRCGERFSL